MQAEIFPDHKFLDFHTHNLRHADMGDFTEIVSIHLGQEKPPQYFTVGLHPWWTRQVLTIDQKQQLMSILSDPFCLAMGEMGLDNLKGPEMKDQIEILSSQLSIAQDLHKPVIIHCVRAFDQLIKLRRDFPEIKKWCIHGFGRHLILARQLIAQGFYLSIMPSVGPEKYEAFFKELPNDRLFLETDSMADVRIDQIYLQVSKLLGVEVTQLCNQMNSNARDFFLI